MPFVVHGYVFAHVKQDSRLGKSFSCAKHLMFRLLKRPFKCGPGAYKVSFSIHTRFGETAVAPTCCAVERFGFRTTSALSEINLVVQKAKKCNSSISQHKLYVSIT